MKLKEKREFEERSDNESHVESIIGAIEHRRKKTRTCLRFLKTRFVVEIPSASASTSVEIRHCIS